MTNQRISDKGSSGKYYHQILNIDDDDLDPYQYRLLGHYRRRCGDGGVCFETVETTAQITQMGINKVRSTRKWLQEHHYIEAVQKSGSTIDIELLDRMPENIQRCSNYPSLIRDHPLTDPLPVPLTDPLGKEEPSKEDPKKNPSAKAEKRPENKSDVPKKPKPRHWTFEVIGLECFSLQRDQINGKGGHIGIVVYGSKKGDGELGLLQLIYGRETKVDEAMDLATSQELTLMFAWYRRTKPGISVPTSSGTIWKALVEYRNSKKGSSTAPIVPPGYKPPIPKLPPPIVTKKEPEYDF